jgi:hypothetical protein
MKKCKRIDASKQRWSYGPDAPDENGGGNRRNEEFKAIARCLRESTANSWQTPSEDLLRESRDER